MIRVFLFLLACVAGTWYLADAIKQKGPGYVYIYYNDYSVETSFWFALFLLIAALASIFILAKVISLLFHYLARVGYLPRLFWMGRAKKLQYQGTLAFLNQHWRMASKKLLKAAKNSETPFLDYVMAARASLAANDIAAAANNAELARNTPDFDENTHDLLQLDIALAQGDITQEHDFLQMLGNYNDKPALLTRAIAVYRLQKRWQALQALLPTIKKHHVLEEAAYSQLLADIATGIMPGLTQPAQRQELKALWKAVARVHDQDSVIQAYCAALIRMKETAEAQKILEMHLKRQWSELLMEQYAMLDSADKLLQLEFAESFLPHHRSSPTLLTSLGIIAKNNAYHAKARDYLLRSIQLLPQVKAYETLADIASIQQDHTQVQHCLRQALALAKHH